MMDQQHWWKLLVSDKSGLMNTDDKPSVPIQTVTIIAVTGVATLSWTDLISVLLNKGYPLSMERILPGRFSFRPGKAGSRVKRDNFYHVNTPSRFPVRYYADFANCLGWNRPLGNKIRPIIFRPSTVFSIIIIISSDGFNPTSRFQPSQAQKNGEDKGTD